MSLHLQLATSTRDLTTLDSPKLQLRLTNQGSEPRNVLRPSADGGALSIHFHNPEGELVRRISSLTRQGMLGDGRIEAIRMREILQPGASLSWTMALAKFMWPLPVGDYSVTAYLKDPEANETLASEPIALRVQAAQVQSLTHDRDNPILDRTDLLFTAQVEGQVRRWLRQHNPKRPLGAWYNEAVPVPPAASNLICAAASFRQTESFEPTMRRWLLWQNGSELQAALVAEGKPTGIGRRGPMPPGRQLLPHAFYNEKDQLFVLFWNPAGRLECCELATTALVPVAAFPLPIVDFQQLVVRCLDGILHILGPKDGLTYWTANLNGEILTTTLVHATTRTLRQATLQPELGRITALFLEEGDTPRVEMVQIDSRVAPEPLVALQELPIAAPFPELAMDASRNGRFHLLATTTHRQLYYCGPQLEPILLASGQERFFPQVLSPGKVYLGFYEEAFGYRFQQFSSSSNPPGLFEEILE